jgi:hypothetical protein
MTSPENFANLQASAMQLGLLALSMEDFSSKIIRHVHDGSKLDDEALSKIKDICIQNLKNSEAGGLSIQKEAKAFNQAVLNLEKLMDSAIFKGRKQD